MESESARQIGNNLLLYLLTGCLRINLISHMFLFPSHITKASPASGLSQVPNQIEQKQVGQVGAE